MLLSLQAKNPSKPATPAALKFYDMGPKFALEGFVIDKDLSFALQSKVIPLVVVSLCLLANAIANVGSFQLVLLILFLTFSKISILHAQAMIDENRIPEFSPPLKIQEF